jgi:hypothetical protein
LGQFHTLIRPGGTSAHEGLISAVVNILYAAIRVIDVRLALVMTCLTEDDLFVFWVPVNRFPVTQVTIVNNNDVRLRSCTGKADPFLGHNISEPRLIMSV